MTGLGEAIAILVALAVLGVLVMAVEAVIAIRASQRTEIPRAGRAIIVVGLLLGLAHGGLGWANLLYSNTSVTIFGLLALAVLGLAIVVGLGRARSWHAVALLAAGVLYQLSFIGGTFVVPKIPIIGPLVEDSRCERDPYCGSAGQQLSGQADLRIDTPAGLTRAQGAVMCDIDDRSSAAVPLGLRGQLAVDAGGAIDVIVDVTRDPFEGALPSVYMYLEGPIAGQLVHGEASGPRINPLDPPPAQFREGTIVFDGLHMETLAQFQPESSLDNASGTLTWRCG